MITSINMSSNDVTSSDVTSSINSSSSEWLNLKSRADGQHHLPNNITISWSHEHMAEANNLRAIKRYKLLLRIT